MRKKGKILFRLFGCAIVLAVILAALVYDSNHRIVSEEFELEFEDLPESFDGFRIVQLSDLHEKVFGEGNADLISQVSTLEPDIIAITGDIVDRDDQSGYISSLVTELSKIAPVYYVTGNHEWAVGAREIISVVEEAGGTALRNEYVVLERDGEEIAIAGIDDPNGPYDMKTPQELEEEVYEAEGDIFTVLLAHRNNYDLYSNMDSDVILCGHAHGGVWRLPFVGGLLSSDHTFFPDYTAGVYEGNGNYIVVSRGLGDGKDIPRFLNNPHIPVIVLKSS